LSSHRRVAAAIAVMIAVGIGFAAWLSGCSPLRSAPGAGAASPAQPAADPDGPAVTLFVVRREWHIEVGFAVADLGPPLRPVSARFPGAKYLTFGFGDRRYFLAKHRNAPVLLGALWPGPALVLVTGLADTPAAAFGGTDVAELMLSAEQARAVQSFIRGSLSQAQPDVDPSPYAPGPYEGSLYYAARQRYSAFHTCNTWAAEALRAGEVPVHVRGVVFAGQLWPRVEKLGEAGIPALKSP